MGKVKGKKTAKSRTLKYSKKKKNSGREPPNATLFFKVLYKANLRLESALHIGCQQASPTGAYEMMKNGAGEYIIPGTSIAGVFLDTIKDIVTEKEKKKNLSLYIEICDDLSDQSRDDQEGRGSPLIFRTTVLGEARQLPVKIRERVKLDNKSRTAEDKKKFSYWEIEPESVNFNVDIEIDNLSCNRNADELQTLTNWVELVLASWCRDGVFFGAHNSSGNGYCKLMPITPIKSVSPSVSSLFTFKKWNICSEDTFSDYLDNRNNYAIDTAENKYLNVKSRFKTWSLSIDIGDEDGCYGTNALLIKGGVSHDSLVSNPSDAVFVNTGSRIYIPGSSLKGSVSNFLGKYGKQHWLETFFGQENSDNQGYLFFPDIFFKPEVLHKTRHLIHIERHAEDEFTRAVLGSGKFSEERLFYAEAKGKIRIPMRFYEKNREDIGMLFMFLKKGCEYRLLSLGANHCYPKITIEEDPI